ncbi:uncharacterized protein PV09_05303 [Verruconis gallopava]|uniref:Uncharacterized protein n=1 Tax=Verruconis gallopava TaxID=253628 RepID=A0A0D1YSG3_9PEZI|nr:uncharacterized protein PV09_05303 [Verruconis gallopava]KIW03542.1 hypothetical protein PV09_05303 [Verruconis gallopava]
MTTPVFEDSLQSSTTSSCEMAVGTGDINDPRNESYKNVLGTTLQLFSRQPLTGFNRDGFCRVTAGDFGNHSVAGVVSEEFLDFTASRGNDLRVVGLSEGCKWCLCASRWKEALDAFRAGRISRNGVPKVRLESTDQSALRTISLQDLEEFRTN